MTLLSGTVPGSAQPREFKLKVIQDLDGIVDAHLLWLNGYHRALVCGEPAGPEVIAADAHCLCAFGVWYGQLDLDDGEPWAVQLRQIAATHQRMHEAAARLVGGPRWSALYAEEYDRFANHAYRFKTGVRALQMDLIREVCLIDHLTGVWNRSSLMQRLAEEHDRMLRHGGGCSLCMMDLDHFKAINDCYGHPAGDQVLQAVAGLAKRQLRCYDAIFRYGGEEFLFCLPRLSAAEAVASMERIRAEISGSPIRLDCGDSVTITASFGIAELSPTLPLADSIDAADHALLLAKAAGRNRICCG